MWGDREQGPGSPSKVWNLRGPIQKEPDSKRWQASFQRSYLRQKAGEKSPSFFLSLPGLIPVFSLPPTQPPQHPADTLWAPLLVLRSRAGENWEVKERASKPTGPGRAQQENARALPRLCQQRRGLLGGLRGRRVKVELDHHAWLLLVWIGLKER